MERKTIIAPSLLAADFSDLKYELTVLKKAGVKYLHFDVMDGHFVPNLSFGPAILQCLKPFDFVMDVHLMVDNPEAMSERFIKAGADILTFHYEAVKNPIALIRSLRQDYPSLKIGMSIKPGTSVGKIVPFLSYLDLILVMSVEPGFGGQSFIYSSILKIEALRRYIDSNDLNVLIEVDGGVNADNAETLRTAGADILVAGTSVFKSDDMDEAVKVLAGELL